MLYFFSLSWFVPLGFSDKVLMRQHPKRITNSVWLWHPWGSVINHVMDVYNRPDPLEAQSAGERGERVGLLRERERGGYIFSFILYVYDL